MIWLLWAAIPGVFLGVELWCRWKLAQGAKNAAQPNPNE